MADQPSQIVAPTTSLPPTTPKPPPVTSPSSSRYDNARQRQRFTQARSTSSTAQRGVSQPYFASTLKPYYHPFDTTTTTTPATTTTRRPVAQTPEYHQTTTSTTTSTYAPPRRQILPTPAPLYGHTDPYYTTSTARRQPSQSRSEHRPHSEQQPLHTAAMYRHSLPTDCYRYVCIEGYFNALQVQRCHLPGRTGAARRWPTERMLL